MSHPLQCVQNCKKICNGAGDLNSRWSLSIFDLILAIVCQTFMKHILPPPKETFSTHISIQAKYRGVNTLHRVDHAAFHVNCTPTVRQERCGAPKTLTVWNNPSKTARDTPIPSSLTSHYSKIYTRRIFFISFHAERRN